MALDVDGWLDDEQMDRQMTMHMCGWTNTDIRSPARIQVSYSFSLISSIEPRKEVLSSCYLLAHMVIDHPVLTLGVLLISDTGALTPTSLAWRKGQCRDGPTDLAWLLPA